MSKRRLLIVDDELEICELIADVALGQGFDAKMVTDPNARRRRRGIVARIGASCP
jgi:DNA-binding response OmpR family regulator